LLAEQEIYVPGQITFRLEGELFLSCLQTGETPFTDGRVLLRPIKIVLTAYRPMVTDGQSVRMP